MLVKIMPLSAASRLRSPEAEEYGRATVGQDGILRPIGNRPLGAFAASQAGRLTIGRRISSCPTVAHADSPSIRECQETSGGQRLVAATNACNITMGRRGLRAISSKE